MAFSSFLWGCGLKKVQEKHRAKKWRFLPDFRGVISYLV
jgi:hypothetical protein